MLKLKIRNGVDLKKYGFVASGVDNRIWFNTIYKGDLGMLVEIVDGVLYFHASVDTLPPNEDDYFSSEEGGFDYREYVDDVSDKLCQEQELPKFSELLATLLADNVIEVVKEGE